MQGVNPGQESFVWLSRKKWAQILPVFWHLFKWEDLFQHVKHEKGQMQKDWTVGLLPSLHISQRAETSRMSCLKRHLHLRLVWSVRPDSGIGHQDPSWVQRTWGDAREHHHHPCSLNPAPIVQLLKWQIKIPSDRCQHPLFSWNILSLFGHLCNFWSL